MDLKAIGKAVAGFISGGSEILSIVDKVLPDRLSEGERLKLQMEIDAAGADRKIKMLEVWNEQEAAFQEHVREMEGTAKDLKAIPILGHVMLFVRGIQRPLWTLATLWIDVSVLSGKWDLSATAGSNGDQAWAILWVINVLTLTVLFGERALQNVMPLIEKLLLAKNGNGK